MHLAVLLLEEIPRGKVVTYKELARVCKTSPRAVGRLMASNEYPQDYPCYKVVASDGTLTGYSGKEGLQGKQKLLEQDGIRLVNNKVPPQYFWHFPQRC